LKGNSKIDGVISNIKSDFERKRTGNDSLQKKTNVQKTRSRKEKVISWFKKRGGHKRHRQGHEGTVRGGTKKGGRPQINCFRRGVHEPLDVTQRRKGIVVLKSKGGGVGSTREGIQYNNKEEKKNEGLHQVSK